MIRSSTGFLCVLACLAALVCVRPTFAQDAPPETPAETPMADVPAAGVPPADMPAPEMPASDDAATTDSMAGEMPAMGDGMSTETMMAEPPPPPPPEIEMPKTLEEMRGRPLDASKKVRALWVDMVGEEVFNTTIAVDRIVKTIADARFSDVYLIVMRHGQTMYPSAHLPTSVALLPDLSDPISYFLRKARENTDTLGNPQPLKVHLVLVPLEAYFGKSIIAAGTGNVLLQHPEWTMLSETGRDIQPGNIFGLDPALEEVQQYCADLVREVVALYPDADGYQIHEMRYPGVTGRWGFGEATVRQYNGENGLSGTPDPEDEGFLAWRRERLTQLVARLVSTIRETAPSARTSVTGLCLGTGPTGDEEWFAGRVYTGALQDWRRWAAEGVTDDVVLMNSFSEKFDVGVFDAWSSFALSGEAASEFIIGLGQAENFAEDVLSQLRRSLMTEAAGVALYSYQEPNIEDIRAPLFYALGTGIFGADSTNRFRRSNVPIDPRFAAEAQDPTAVALEKIERPEYDIAATDEEITRIFGSQAVEGGAPGGEAATTDGGADAGGRAEVLLPDEILLKNRQLLRGRILDEAPAAIRFRLESGFEVSVARDEIEQVRRAKR